MNMEFSTVGHKEANDGTEKSHRFFGTACSGKVSNPQLRRNRMSIHQAILERTWFEVSRMVESNPNELKEKDVNGRTPLHCACDSQPPLNIVRLLTKGYPDALRERDDSGSTPLHAACLNNAAFGVVKFLASEYPQAVQEINGVGGTPLHDALWSVYPGEVSSKVVEMLYEMYPEALKETDSEGYTPLHRACESRVCLPFEMFSTLVRKYPEVLKVKTNGGYTALHLACKWNVSFKVISLMINVCPETLEETDFFFGDTPLHLACQTNVPVEVIMLLIRNCPTALEEINGRGHTPLHDACDHKAQQKSITMLLERYPEASKVENSDGDTPLHLACRSGLPLRVVLPLLERYPAAVSQKNRDDQTPLDIINDEDPSSHVAEYITQVDILLNGEVDDSILKNILSSFTFIRWYRGIDLMFEINPEIMQKILLDIPNEVIPDLLSIMGHHCKMLSVWNMISNKQEIFN